MVPSGALYRLHAVRLTDEQLAVRDLARDFSARFLRVGTAEADERAVLGGELFAHLAEAGFLGMLAPEEADGLDLDFTSYLLVMEELARGDASVAVAVGAHNGPTVTMVRNHGTPEQRARWLPELASGRAVGAFALAEPEAGSDASSIAAEAMERTGGGWRLSGVKRWVTNGASAGLAVVFARTASTGVSAFLVDPRSDGYRILERESTMGLCGLEVATICLDDVDLDRDSLLGEPGRGLSHALAAVDVGRAGIAAVALGIARAAFDHVTSYAAERRQFGRPLREFGAIQAKLADMTTRIHAASLLVQAAAEAVEVGRRGGAAEAKSRAGDDTAAAAMAKLAASETATWSANEAVQVFGGYGYMKHYPVERLLRDAQGTELLGGTSDVLRRVIVRGIFGLDGANGS